MDSPFQYYEDFKIRILGSCNGLICLGINTPSGDFYHRRSDSICVWNPATREYKDIPLPSAPSSTTGRDYNRDYNLNSYEEYNIIYGFGYDCNIDNYKLVKFTHYKTSGHIQGEVYTLGSDKWKTIHVDNRYSFPDTSSGLLLNGALHWLCGTTTQNKSTILSFNISNEGLISFPIPAENMQCANLGVLGECLCLLPNEWVSNDVWVMLNYGARESWTKQFTLKELCCSTGYFNRFSCDLEVLRSLYKGETILRTWKGFIVHDPNNGSKLEPEVSFQGDILKGGCVYAESLVSLNSVIYVGRGKHMAAKRIATRTYLQALIN
ncbi:F-box/kelch-repeat protein At3g06240-like [Papaver somniferum]|uniref:F-box/kelch-repeat protein At3g06240-like n=1 Tax=Papaver somniferum TaxID=3469 RepID=UPI000E701A46|nr:F-box/kelch-repeat protein At3g06240-like [Papaver somniferum]